MTSGQAWQRMQRAIDAKLTDPTPQNITALRQARDDLTSALEREGPVGARRFKRDTAAAKRAAFTLLKP